MILVFVSAACSASHGPDGAPGADAGPPAPPPDVAISFTTSSFYTCRCHHGCGPGIDGEMVVTIDNGTRRDVTVTLVGLALVPEAGGPDVVAGGYVAGPTPVPQAVAARSVLEIPTSPYLELSSDPEAVAGRYTPRLLLELDGTRLEIAGEPIDIPYSGGDPGCG